MRPGAHGHLYGRFACACNSHMAATMHLRPFPRWPCRILHHPAPTTLSCMAVLPAAEVVETSGAALVNGGVSEAKKMVEKLAKGGVLFLDEAYQLQPKTNPMGAQVGRRG